MLKGPLVFVDIDTQRDFLDPRGSTFLPDAESILPNLARLTTFARDRDIPVLATSCSHPPDEAAPGDLPTHCVTDTKGAERVEQTRWPGSLVLAPEGPFAPPHNGETTPRHLTLQKRGPDLFTHPEAARVVDFYNHNEPTFVVYGVGTDRGVAAAVRGLAGRGHRVALVTDAIAEADADAKSTLLDELEGLGVRRTTTDDVCGAG